MTTDFNNDDFMTMFNPSMSSVGLVGIIDVYFTGNSYLSKVVVTPNVSDVQTIIYPDSPNTTITITDLQPNFSFPVSVVSWGKDFSGLNPSKYRMVSLFNQTSCRIDFDIIQNTLVFTNATTTNLGCLSIMNMPTTEILAAKLFVCYMHIVN